MGLLDTILGVLGAGEVDQAQEGGKTNKFVSIVGELIKQQGGLQGLMGRFTERGLGEQFSSWVGLGQNKEISADQIQQVLGNEHVAALAQKFGIDPADASAMISKYLPKIVDKLTPTGEVNPNMDVQSGLESMAKARSGEPLE